MASFGAPMPAHALMGSTLAGSMSLAAPRVMAMVPPPAAMMRPGGMPRPAAGRLMPAPPPQSASRSTDDEDEDRTMATRAGRVFTPSSAFPVASGPRSEEPATLRPPPAAADEGSLEEASYALRAPSAAPGAGAPTGAPPASDTARTAPPPALGYRAQSPSIRTKEESEPLARAQAMMTTSPAPKPVRSQRWLLLLVAALVALVIALAAILAWVLFTR
jgi:hypothetical protein